MCMFLFANSVDFLYFSRVTCKLAFDLICENVLRCLCGVVSVRFCCSSHCVLTLYCRIQWEYYLIDMDTLKKYVINTCFEWQKINRKGWGNSSLEDEMHLINPRSVRPSWPSAEWHVVLSFPTETTSNPFFSGGGGEIACRPVTYKADEDKQCLPTLCWSTKNYQALKFVWDKVGSIWFKIKRKLSTSDAKMEAWSYSTNLPERSVLFPMIICKIIIINDHCEMMIINDYLRDSPWSHLDLRVSPPPPASLSSWESFPHLSHHTPQRYPLPLCRSLPPLLWTFRVLPCPIVAV